MLRFLLLLLVVVMLISKAALGLKSVSQLASRNDPGTKLFASLPKRLPLLSSSKSKELLKEERDRAKDLLEFIDESPEPFHAVATSITKLEKLGFKKLKESDIWDSSKVQVGSKYFFTRAGSSIVAFAVGPKYVDEYGVRMLHA